MADIVFEKYPKSDSWVKVEYTTSGFQAKNTRGFEYLIKNVDSPPNDEQEAFYCTHLDAVSYADNNFLYIRNKEQDIEIAVRI